jgi:hypothetical protein
MWLEQHDRGELVPVRAENQRVLQRRVLYRTSQNPAVLIATDALFTIALLSNVFVHLMLRSSFEFAFFKPRGGAVGYVTHVLLGLL